MAQFSTRSVISIESPEGIYDFEESDEYDEVPLNVRLKRPPVGKPPLVSPAVSPSELQNRSKTPKEPEMGIKEEVLRHDLLHVPSFSSYYSSGKEKNQHISQEVNHACKYVSGVKVEVPHCCNRKCSKKRMESVSSNLMSAAEGGESDHIDVASLDINVKNEVTNDMADGLDQIVLKERLKMIRSKLSGFANPVLEDDSLCWSNSHFQHIGNKVMEGSSTDQTEVPSISRTNASDFCHPLISAPPIDSITASSCTTGDADAEIEGLTKSKRYQRAQEVERISSSEFGEQKVVSVDCVSIPVKVKDEPLDDEVFESAEKFDGQDLLYNSVGLMKKEAEFSGEFERDTLDRIPLCDRLEMLKSGGTSTLDDSADHQCSKEISSSPQDFKCSEKILSSPQYLPIVSESSRPVTVNRSRKRKKTATDSIEIALEEDAPGLLQVLVAQGVPVNELKLYEGTDIDDVSSDLLIEDNFADLEAIISKLFPERHSLLKLAPLRCTKGSKTRYSVACLLSLVEQTRYLQFRKWPVEWGWCRDLQSFIFVFEKHNRIVLERPEYGYATYFFELVDALPVDWQIRRLVIAMKVTNCSRANIIENRALLVGEELTEGEAKVLMGYGWMPNSGLGTMLNYCDRVVHDRNHENISEWRSKIGKLLKDGYNGGSIVTTTIPSKVMECPCDLNHQIKLEQ